MSNMTKIALSAAIILGTAFSALTAAGLIPPGRLAFERNLLDPGPSSSLFSDRQVICVSNSCCPNPPRLCA